MKEKKMLILTLIPEGAKEVDLDDGKYIYKVTDKYTTPGFIQSKKK